ncbi:phospholipase A [Hydrogenovibrio sp. SC-1]|uniref:phospholipase A n=1 Tax=Hydrogenovibrio sp. SC-1 TaxID=2065820 RepID=UPI001303F479|nr:phospholipase A [Hydrogenovibrio sp. SC-1]
MNNRLKISYLIGLVLIMPLALAETDTETESFMPAYDSNCLRNGILSLPPETPLADIRKQCLVKDNKPTEPSAVEQRLQSQRFNKNDQFSLQTYLPNYVLLDSFHFSGVNDQPFSDQFLKDERFDPLEIKFQFSVKVPISDNFIGVGDHWFVGYTNRSFWQAYNHHISSPFRETNHQPEGWISFDNQWNFLGWKNRLIDVGLIHQSNGKPGSLSRSWNRGFLRFVFEQGNSAFVIKPWIRIPESASSDDNADISYYLGRSEFLYATKYSDHHYRVMLRNNFNEKRNKGAIELGYSFPVHRNLNFYAQWFYGYGESLIDYNYLNNTLSIGVQLGNLL